MEFTRQEYWSGLPFPPPGVLLDPGIESVFPALAGRFFTTSTTCEALCDVTLNLNHYSAPPENTPPALMHTYPQIQNTGLG